MLNVYRSSQSIEPETISMMKEDGMTLLYSPRMDCVNNALLNAVTLKEHNRDVHIWMVLTTHGHHAYVTSEDIVYNKGVTSAHEDNYPDLSLLDIEMYSNKGKAVELTDTLFAAYANDTQFCPYKGGAITLGIKEIKRLRAKFLK